MFCAWTNYENELIIILKKRKKNQDCKNAFTSKMCSNKNMVQIILFIGINSTWNGLIVWLCLFSGFPLFNEFQTSNFNLGLWLCCKIIDKRRLGFVVFSFVFLSVSFTIPSTSLIKIAYGRNKYVSEHKTNYYCRSIHLPTHTHCTPINQISISVKNTQIKHYHIRTINE